MKVRELLISAVLVLLGWVLAEGALTVRAWRCVPERVATMADERLADVTARADEQLSLLRRDLRDEIGRTRSELRGEITAARVAVLGTIRPVIENANQVITDARGLVVSADGVIEESRATVASVHAAVDEARPFVRSWSSLAPAMSANTLGTLAAVKVATGEFAQTMRHIRLATPEIVAAVRASADAATVGSQAAARTAENLAAVTRPAPKWVRGALYGVSIAAPVSTVALPFVIRKIQSGSVPTTATTSEH
jgi:hypothetical protein